MVAHPPLLPPPPHCHYRPLNRLPIDNGTSVVSTPEQNHEEKSQHPRIDQALIPTVL